MTNEEIKSMALSSGFTLRNLTEDGPDLHPYVYEFANRLLVQQYEEMLAEGYRFCAKGQHTTQFCGQLEEAVEKAVNAEREACAMTVREMDLRGEEIAAANTIRARGKNA